MDAHEAVYESAAVGVQPEGGEADKLVVYVIPAREVDTRRLAAELGKMLGRELNPLFKIYDLVITDQLPRTASNKPVRGKLRSPYMREKEARVE